MRIFFLFLFVSNLSLYAKEWGSIRIFHKVTHKENLSSSDWLKSDRIHNTSIWQQANAFNLENNLSQEYKSIVERRDFYEWLYIESEKIGHEVLWFKMVHFISNKLHKAENFPLNIFVDKKIMQYANSCSEIIFNNAFNEVKSLFKLELPLTEKQALEWDKDMFYKEQYVWVDGVINTIDAKSVQKIERVLQGEFLYSLLVPKEIRFDGNLTNREERYNYALNKLRLYCQKVYN